MISAAIPHPGWPYAPVYCTSCVNASRGGHAGWALCSRSAPRRSRNYLAVWTPSMLPTVPLVPLMPEAQLRRHPLLPRIILLPTCCGHTYSPSWLGRPLIVTHRMAVSTAHCVAVFDMRLAAGWPCRHLPGQPANWPIRGTDAEECLEKDAHHRTTSLTLALVSRIVHGSSIYTDLLDTSLLHICSIILTHVACDTTNLCFMPVATSAGATQSSNVVHCNLLRCKQVLTLATSSMQHTA
jgi:hypothetical protein